MNPIPKNSEMANTLWLVEFLQSLNQTKLKCGFVSP